jgi:hypothetical protein
MQSEPLLGDVHYDDPDYEAAYIQSTNLPYYEPCLIIVQISPAFYLSPVLNVSITVSVLLLLPF